jgi:hypothetical protein
MEPDDVLGELRLSAAQHTGLGLLVLHGSRSRGDTHAASDWDFGYLADARFEPADLSAALTGLLGTDDVDLVDLSRASALLRFETARSGRLVYEAIPGTHEAFVLEATRFWCDVEPVLRRAHAAVLSELPD